MPEIDLPVEADGCKHVYQMYTIKVKPPVERNHFVNRLKEEGIGASVHFDPPVHVQPIYRAGGCSGEPLPVTDRVADSIVTLPMYPSLTQGQLDRIVASVKKVIRG
jgi:perosamine synthetase